NVDAFLSFLRRIKGSVPQIDCMIEAKMKDESLFQLMRDLSEQVDVEIIDGASFYIK
ncbi:UV damage endonuclease UvsE, partial [Bacillus cereus]